MATLLGRLLARPREQINALAEIWSVTLPGRSHAEDVALLYRTMTDTWAMRDLLEDLPLDAARLLWDVARTNGELMPRDAPPTALVSLAEQGFIHASAAADAPLPVYVLADETRALCRRLADERRTRNRHTLPLAALLASLDVGELAAAAEWWQVDFTPGSEPRAAAEARLIEAVARPFALDQLLTRLGRDERRIYDLLATAPRPRRLAELRRRSGLAPVSFRRILRQLHSQLLVWEAWHARERHLFVPAELRPTQTLPSQVPLVPVTAEPEDWRHPLAAAWDLLAGLRLAGMAGIDTSAQILPARDGVPSSDPLWYGTTALERAAYRRFLRSAAAALRLDDPQERERWPAQPLIKQQAAIYEAWRQADPAWEADPRAGATEATNEWTLVRAAVLHLLAGLQPDAWYPVETLVTHTTIDQARSDQRQPAVPVGPRRYQGDRVNQIARAILQTACIWLGLVAPGLETDHLRPVLRLTHLGAWLLGQAPAPEMAPASVLVEPSLRVLVFEADTSLLWNLLAFAEPVHLDRVSIFQLSRASVIRGLGAGIDSGTAIDTLTRAARHPVPQNVVYALRDWSRLTQHARLQRALILTFDDERWRDEALSLPMLRALQPEPLPRARLAIPCLDEEAERRARVVLASLGFESLAGG